MSIKVGDVVIPGDILTEAKEQAAKNKKIVLGHGLCTDIVTSPDEIQSPIVTRSGVLCKRNPNIYYVDSFQKRYIPAKNDTVIGLVQTKTMDFYWVDINAAEPAALSYLAFEGATKKNRPEINVGDLLCCKVVLANPDLEPELVCVDSTGKKGNLGLRTEGFMFQCSINLVRKILNKKCTLLHLLSKETPFELDAGINGRIWINAKSARTCILLRDTILKAENTPYDEIKGLVEDFAAEMTGIPT